MLKFSDCVTNQSFNSIFVGIFSFFFLPSMVNNF